MTRPRSWECRSPASAPRASKASEIDVPIELSEITPDAVFGADARGCSAETGAKLVEALTELGARFVRHYAEKTQ